MPRPIVFPKDGVIDEFALGMLKLVGNLIHIDSAFCQTARQKGGPASAHAQNHNAFQSLLLVPARRNQLLCAFGYPHFTHLLNTSLKTARGNLRFDAQIRFDRSSPFPNVLIAKPSRLSWSYPCRSVVKTR